MANKTVKDVTEKKEVKKFDFKVIAESIEQAFKDSKSITVIADSNRTEPKSMSYTEYSFIHFYTPGTEKDMFQLYINSKGAKFIVSSKVADYLDKGLNTKASGRYILVFAKFEDVSATAEKIIEAFKNVPAKEPKPKKKAEKDISAKSKAEKKSATPQKATPKKVANK